MRVTEWALRIFVATDGRVPFRRTITGYGFVGVERKDSILSNHFVSTDAGLSLSSGVTMARNIEDAFGKNILHDLFRLRGLAETEAEVPPGNAKRIDVWFVPENNVRTVNAPVFGSVLSEMAADSAVIELWSEAPSGDDFHKTFGKREVWHDTLELRAKGSVPRPPLWHICAGKPVKVIQEFGLEVTDIPGLYRPMAPGWRVHGVVLSELPTTRDTILLRLLGRGRVRRGAMRELRSLPDDAWEKQIARPWLVRLEFERPSELVHSREEREFIMDVHAWYADWYEEKKRSLRDEFMREIEPQLADERRQVEARLADERRQTEARIAEAQRQAEINPLVHLFERRLGRPLKAGERDVLKAQVQAHGSDRVMDVALDLSPADIAAWLEHAEVIQVG